MKMLTQDDVDQVTIWGRVFMKVIDTTEVILRGLSTDAVRLETLTLLQKLSAKEVPEKAPEAPAKKEA